MDTKTLDKVITQIIERKLALSTLTYSDKKYDIIEEELHDLEDEFIENYGDYFEEILEKVHEKICPDTDVLLPTAYVAKKYIKKGKNADGSTDYDVDYKEGVWVDSDKFPGKDTRLVLIPNPTRIVFSVEGKSKEVVWKAE